MKYKEKNGDTPEGEYLRFSFRDGDSVGVRTQDLLLRRQLL